MKKIKGILLFGILTLLGIGSSFGYLYQNYQFEFKSNNNNNILFNVNPGNSNISSLLMSYQDDNGDRNSLNILRRSSTSTTNLFNISNYSVSSFSSYSYSTAKIYSSSSCLDLSVTGSSYQLLFHLFGDNNCNSTSNGTIGSREVYINVGDSCINSGVMNTGNCDYGFYKYFGFNGTFDSRFDSLIQDNQYSGSNAGKTSISFPFSDSYSFRNQIAWSGYELPLVYEINQKYLVHSGDSFTSYVGLFITRINDFNSTFSNSDFQVLALDYIFNGSLIDSYFKYGIFDCPYSAQDILDCSFNDGGTISNLYIANSITGNVLQFLTTRDGFYVGSSYNYFSNFLRNKLSTDGTLTFYRFLSPNNATSPNAPSWLSTSVQLVSDGNNYFQDLFPGGNLEQLTGLNVIPFSSLYYQCLGPSYNTPDGLPPSFCLNPDGTLINVDDYRDCYFTLSSSGDLMENMFCNNDGYVQEMAWVGEGSGGYYSACYGEDCGVMFVFGPSYLNFENSFNLTTGLILDMITNVTGWVAKCPYPYTDFQLGKNSNFLNYLKTLGFKYDPFIFINCVVAGFHYGRHTIDNTMFGDTFEHPLLYGDTPKHRTLFVFLDFIVVLGLFGLFAFIRKIF